MVDSIYLCTSYSPRHSPKGSNFIGVILSLGWDVEECIGLTKSSMSSWKRFSGRGEVKTLGGLYVIPDTPIPTSMLLPMFILIAGSILLDTVKPSGEEIGLSKADSAGLIRKSCMLPVTKIQQMNKNPYVRDSN